MNDQERKYFDALSESRSKDADALDRPNLRGVKKSIVDKYSDQAHFVYELIQNADDAGATEASFEAFEDKLVFSHNGKRHFHVTNPETEGEDYDNHTLGDINAITGIGLSSKSESNKKGNAIGKFGMGFKSIFQYTTTPEIYDPNVSFRIERQIVPKWIGHDYPGRKPDDTLFVFPYNNAEAKRPANDSLEKLRSLLFPTLFLNNLKTISFNSGGGVGEYCKLIESTKEFGKDNNLTLCENIVYTKILETVESTRLLLFSRTDEENHRYSIGFKLDANGRLETSDYKAFCFFPTMHQTNLKFLIHAPFLLTDSREMIKEFEDHNKRMVDKLSDLAHDCWLYMREMRALDGGRLLDDGVLEILPMAEWGHSSFFCQFWEKTAQCFIEEKVLPTDCDYVKRSDAYWPVAKQIPMIFSDQELQKLYCEPDSHWVFRNRWNDPNMDDDLRRFIKNCVKDSPSETSILGKITDRFIEEQSISWLSTFYKWIDDSDERRRKARKLPIFLNQEKKAVAAFDLKDQPILFLPAPGADNYETVNEELWRDANAKELLERYKVAQPSEADLIRCIVDDKLPKCEGEETDLLFKKVIEYYAHLTADAKPRFAADMKGKVVSLACVTLTAEERSYKVASDLYMPSDLIKEFFKGVDNVYLVDTAHYRKLIGEDCWSDFESLLKHIGVAEYPVIKKRQLGYLEMSDFKRCYEELGRRFRSPALSRSWEEKFTVRFIHGGSAFLRRILDEKDADIKKHLSQTLWAVLRHRASCEPNFLVGWHEFQNYGLHREEFDSQQLLELRSEKWIVLDEWTSVAPNELPINKLPKEYDRVSDGDTLVKLLNFLPPEVPAVDQAKVDEEEKKKADAESYAKLSDEQKRTMDLGNEVESLGLTSDDLKDAARRKAERKRNEDLASAAARNFLDDVCQVECENDRLADVEDCDSVENENRICGRGEDKVHVREHDRSFPNTIMGRIEGGVNAIKEAYKSNMPPPPLPDPDEDDEDDDELLPKAIDFGRRIRDREKRQVREIAELERGDELQQAAQISERYSYGWFKNMLELEMLGRAKDDANQRELTISFTRMERETDTERTFVLKRPSRNIPQWLEELSGIPLEMTVGRQTIRPVIEVMSVQSFNLRVKLKATTKLEGVDLQKLIEARIVAQKPAFLMEELKKGLCALPFEDNKNLRNDLTEKIEFIFGPPGTGKTTFLAGDRIIPIMLREKNNRVLVLAPTNKAADVLTSRIISKMGDDTSYRNWLIRFGATLDESLEKTGVCPGKDVDLKKYPRHTVITTIARFPYDFCITGNSVPQKLVDQEWDYVIIDEASMIPLVSIIYPLYRKKTAQFIIAGDPFQIEPIITSDLWKDENIYTMVGLRDFANPKTVPHEYKVVKLTTQYRSIPSVGNIFSQYRYGGILTHMRQEKSRQALQVTGIPEIRPLTIIKFPVRPYESIYRLKQLGLKGGSSYQIYSALFAYEFVCAIARKMEDQKAKFRIGIISPYRAQADIVQRLVEATKLPDYVQVSAGTVHGFQGDECEMIVSLFNPPPGISGRKGSFVNKKNVINVAVSRARDYLVVMMPDDDTPNIGNMYEVRKIEALMRKDADNFVVHKAFAIEDWICNNPRFIEENSFSTGHQAVNVYGVPEKRYEIRTEDTAVDIQIHEGARIVAPIRENDDAVSCDNSVGEKHPVPSSNEMSSIKAFVDFALRSNRNVLEEAKKYAFAVSKVAAANNKNDRSTAIVAGFEMKKHRNALDACVQAFQKIQCVKIDANIAIAALVNALMTDVRKRK